MLKNLTLQDNSAQCEVVPATFGVPVDMQLMHDFPEEAQSIVEQRLLSTAIPYDVELSNMPWEVARAVEIGNKSQRIKFELGCTACNYSGECSVEKLLDRNSEQGMLIEGVNKDMSMLASAPSWLRTVRGRKTGVDITTPEGERTVGGQLKSLLSTDTQHDTIPIPTENIKQEFHQLLGGVINAPLPDKSIEELPSLANLTAVEQRAKLGRSVPGTRIQFEGDEARTYDVYDATAVVDFKGEPLSREDNGIILEKLYDRIHEVDAKGQAQIAHPDGTMQKPLHKGRSTSLVPNLYELRMNGKNRLYFTYEAADTHAEDTRTRLKSGTNSGRIVILGGHGGDVSTQNDFLNHIGIG